jgi:hypothetical protein
VWNGGGPGGALAQGLKPGETLPLLASAKALMDLRATREMDDPFFWCMPMGVPRTTPYPFRFVQNYTHKAPTHRPFTVTYPAALSPPSDELMENFCQENNQFGIAGGNVNPYTK